MARFKFNQILTLFIICDYLYQSGYYSYLIKVGLGWSKDANSDFALYEIYAVKVAEKLGLLLEKLFQ
jgi:hypothetical protein